MPSFWAWHGPICIYAARLARKARSSLLAGEPHGAAQCGALWRPVLEPPSTQPVLTKARKRPPCLPPAGGQPKLPIGRGRGTGGVGLFAADIQHGTPLESEETRVCTRHTAQRVACNAAAPKSSFVVGASSAGGSSAGSSCATSPPAAAPLTAAPPQARAKALKQFPALLLSSLRSEYLSCKRGARKAQALALRRELEETSAR